MELTDTKTPVTEELKKRYTAKEMAILAEPVELFIDKEEDISETPTKTKKTSTETPKKTRTTARPIETLLEIIPKNLTPLERIKVIEYYKTQNAKLTTQFDLMTKNAETAYTQFKNADESYKALKYDADNKLRFAVKAAEMCYKTINLIGGTE